jgi:superfamily II DNA or RNA helicase/HKD family nuclease
MRNASLITQGLLEHLTPWFEDATAIYLLIAFVRASGVAALASLLARAVARGAEIKVLTGDYLYLTEPEGLAQLLDLGVEVRLFRSGGESFHPKAFLFQSDRALHLVVGSSNLSQSGLIAGIEWNLGVDGDLLEPEDPVAQFLSLYYAEPTEPVNRVTLEAYRRERERAKATTPALSELWASMDSAPSRGDAFPFVPTDDQGEPIRLRPAQEEALRALYAAWEERQSKGLVVLPTGLGKTYLAAFAAHHFRRVLFVAHREEILRQALATFQRVHPTRRAALFTGRQKGSGELLFASVYTLAQRRHRARFAPDAFDLIVVDEFHHAAAPVYSQLLTYFRPKFWLGLTATPERRDHKDLYALCDGNLVYQLSLPEAIGRGWLVPFHYFGKWDPTDYNQIPWRRTHYDPDQLAYAQLRETFAELVLQAWRSHRQERTLAFCAGVAQADYFARYFSRRGVAGAALSGRSSWSERQQAIAALRQGRLSVLFSVDLFNEGLDLPGVDTILLVRPTDSSVVFLQQIGRGLRPAPGKTACTIIDLVGNYRNADQRLAWLGVPSTAATLRRLGTAHTLAGLPPGCSISLDLKLIDLLKRLVQRRAPRPRQLVEAYTSLQAELGRRPTYLEFCLASGIEPMQAVRDDFGSWVGLLEAAGALSETEAAAYRATRGWFETLERTQMAQSYKMVLLEVMLARGESRWDQPITPEEAALPFFEFLQVDRRWAKERQPQPLLQPPFRRAEVAALIARNPMTFLARSAPEYFRWDGERFAITLPGLAPHREAIYQWTRETVTFRLHRYFAISRSPGPVEPTLPR